MCEKIKIIFKVNLAKFLLSLSTICHPIVLYYMYNVSTFVCTFLPHLPSQQVHLVVDVFPGNSYQPTCRRE